METVSDGWELTLQEEVCTLDPVFALAQDTTLSRGKIGGGGLAGFSTSLVTGGALAGGGGFPGLSVFATGVADEVRPAVLLLGLLVVAMAVAVADEVLEVE